MKEPYKLCLFFEFIIQIIILQQKNPIISLQNESQNTFQGDNRFQINSNRHNPTLYNYNLPMKFMMQISTWEVIFMQLKSWLIISMFKQSWMDIINAINKLSSFFFRVGFRISFRWIYIERKNRERRRTTAMTANKGKFISSLFIKFKFIKIK